MKSSSMRVAAVVASAGLAFSGATGVASAQEDESGSLNADSLGVLSAGSGEGSLEGPDQLGSIILEPDATGEGSLDTSGSALLGEPTTGSLSDLAGSVIDATDTNSITPAEGTGSVDTSGSALLGEPTTGSLAPIYAPIAGSLGIGGGATTIIGSEGAGSLLPVAAVGGSVALIAAGIHFAPEIQQAIADAGIHLAPPAPQGGQAPMVPQLPDLGSHGGPGLPLIECNCENNTTVE